MKRQVAMGESQLAKMPAEWGLRGFCGPCRAVGAVGKAGCGEKNPISGYLSPCTIRLHNKARLFAALAYKRDGDAQHHASVTFRLLPGPDELDAG